MSTQAKYNNEQAIEIIQGEGLGYAVTDYCRGDNFEDPETVQLWNAARRSLRDLCEYLEGATGREIDE